MRCKRCGQEMKIKSVEVGKDEQGNPIYNDYAFCYECKIKVNLEKRAAKAVKPEPEKETTEEQEEVQVSVEETQEPAEEVVAHETVQSAQEEMEQNLENVEEDLGLTKRIELESEKLKEETDGQPEIPKKRPPKKRPEQAKKKAERKPKDMPEKRVKEQPAKKRPASEKESRRQHEKRIKEMPEKRVKEIYDEEETGKKKGKGFVKFLVFLLIVAALGAAVYFNRNTVKGWINTGLQKFDLVSDNQEDEAEDMSGEDIVDEAFSEDSTTTTE